MHASCQHIILQRVSGPYLRYIQRQAGARISKHKTGTNAEHWKRQEVSTTVIMEQM